MAFHLRRQLTTSGALSQVLTTYAHDAVAYPGRKHAKAWKRSIVSITWGIGGRNRVRKPSTKGSHVRLQPRLTFGACTYDSGGVG